MKEIILIILIGGLFIFFFWFLLAMVKKPKKKIMRGLKKQKRDKDGERNSGSKDYANDN